MYKCDWNCVVSFYLDNLMNSGSFISILLMSRGFDIVSQVYCKLEHVYLTLPNLHTHYVLFWHVQCLRHWVLCWGVLSTWHELESSRKTKAQGISFIKLPCMQVCRTFSWLIIDVGSVIHGQVVLLGCIRKEETKGSKPISQINPYWFLPSGSSPVLSSWWTVTYMTNKPFLPHVAFGPGIYHSNKNQITENTMLKYNWKAIYLLSDLHFLSTCQCNKIHTFPDLT